MPSTGEIAKTSVMFIVPMSLSAAFFFSAETSEMLMYFSHT
jgi:hypothetical protein